MPEDRQMTHVEHFIPKMYLRQFSDSKTSLYRYNVNNLEKEPELRSLDKVCREIDMYELFGKDGSYITPNRIENIFGKIEKNTSKVIEFIKVKSQNDNCLKCASVLSENEKSLLIIFMTTLLYRDPQTIENGINFLQQSNPDMDIREARNFTLMNLLPLGVDSTWDENTIIRTAINSLCGMAFQIGISEDDVIITSDRPVIWGTIYKDDSYNRPSSAIFPLTSRLVLYLFPIESVDPIVSNCFIKLNNEQIDDIQANVAVYARDWIFSRNALTDAQLNNVKNARSLLQQ
ncbi:MAG: DUF4238 domain-containing protein [Ruminiclostridium sp.]|nr:DUF4238 domain-containing protein [Ruminiclostridium sp.]